MLSCMLVRAIMASGEARSRAFNVFLFCPVLFCSVLFCSVLFCSVLFCSFFSLTICAMQVAPTFGDAPGVLRDSRAKAMPPPGLHTNGPPSSSNGATVTMVFCAPAQYKVLVHVQFVPQLLPSNPPYFLPSAPPPPLPLLPLPAPFTRLHFSLLAFCIIHPKVSDALLSGLTQ